MSNNEFEDFIALVREKKSRKQMHSLAQERLTSYLSHLYPHDIISSEIAGVLGGRNDLMQFTCNGRRIVFEFFFSPSQVPQDLRLLEQAKADTKIAILLDRELNPKLANEYCHKKPDSFPFLWLSDLMLQSRKEHCITLLCKFIDEITPNFSMLLAGKEISSGTQMAGKYRLVEARASREQALWKIIENLTSISKGYTYASISMDTRESSSLNEVAGNVTIQY